MKQLRNLKLINSTGNLKDLPRAKNDTPMKFVGTIVPWRKGLHPGVDSDFKIVTQSGMEYFILNSQKWQESLQLSCWKNVRIEGDLDITLMTIKLKRLLFDDPEPQLIKSSKPLEKKCAT